MDATLPEEIRRCNREGADVDFGTEKFVDKKRSRWQKTLSPTE
jgi:hypothetical protein